jgi:hypothetical protein
MIIVTLFYSLSCVYLWYPNIERKKQIENIEQVKDLSLKRLRINGDMFTKNFKRSRPSVNLVADGSW